MKKTCRNSETDCPLTIALNAISGKWKILIIHHLIDKETLRFGELKKLFPELSQKMLTTCLRELEADQLLNRKVYAEVPPKVEYSLTEHARKLNPILVNLANWGEEHKSVTTK